MLVAAVWVVGALLCGVRAQDVDCTEIDGAQAVDGVCICKQPDYVTSSDRASCIPIAYGGYGASCTDTAQCVERMEGGASCVDGACACVENFHYLHGRCWRNKGYGEECSRNESCYAYSDSDSMTCSANHCACGDYTYSPHSSMCKRQAEVGEPCDFDLDCPAEASCNTQTYICEQTATSPIEDSDFVLFEDLSARAGDSCPGANMEITAGGQCICMRGYYQLEAKGDCLPELGESCNNDTDCSHITSALCRRSGSTGGRICGCQGSWAPAANNRECVKTRKYNFNCQVSPQCSYYGGICTSGKCVCPEGHHHTGELCWPAKGLGATCEVSRDCYVASESGVDCISNVCQCTQGYRQTASNDCWKIAEALRDPCEDDSQCNFATDPDTVECSRNKCACKAGYMRLNSTTCVVGAGGPCSVTEDCSAVPTYECVNSICACPEDTVTGIFTTQCLPVATEYGDNCTETVQCTRLLGTEGICDTEQGICVCTAGYHYRGGQCWMTKRLGDDCDHASQCYADQHPERLECRDSMCFCKYEFREDTGSLTCSSSSKLYFSLIPPALWILILRFL